NVNVNVQLDSASPVFLMTSAPWNAPCHSPATEYWTEQATAAPADSPMATRGARPSRPVTRSAAPRRLMEILTCKVSEREAATFRRLRAGRQGATRTGEPTAMPCSQRVWAALAGAHPDDRL